MFVMVSSYIMTVRLLSRRAKFVRNDRLLVQQQQQQASSDNSPPDDQEAAHLSGSLQAQAEAEGEGHKLGRRASKSAGECERRRREASAPPARPKGRPADGQPIKWPHSHSHSHSQPTGPEVSGGGEHSVAWPKVEPSPPGPPQTGSGPGRQMDAEGGTLEGRELLICSSFLSPIPCPQPSQWGPSIKAAHSAPSCTAPPGTVFADPARVEALSRGVCLLNGHSLSSYIDDEQQQQQWRSHDELAPSAPSSPLPAGAPRKG